MKHRLGDDLATAHQATSGSVLNIPGVGDLIAWGNTVPTDADAGYAKGCLFIHTDATGETDLLYSNISGTSGNFNAVTVAADA